MPEPEIRYDTKHMIQRTSKNGTVKKNSCVLICVLKQIYISKSLLVLEKRRAKRVERIEKSQHRDRQGDHHELKTLEANRRKSIYSEIKR